MLLNDKYIYIFSSVEALRGHLDMLGLNHKFEISLLKRYSKISLFNNIIILSLIVIILMILLLKVAFLTLPTKSESFYKQVFVFCLYIKSLYMNLLI